MKNGKTLFIIPGFKEKISDPQYVALRRAFMRKGFDVHVVPIVWDRRVMTDWVVQFEKYFFEHRGAKNAVLGFSFGAMIALVTAQRARPDALVLCSLSPYFAEDLSMIPERWRRFIGKRRTEDFARYSMKQTVKGISIPAQVFIGGAEQQKFRLLAARCARAATVLGCPVTVIDGVKHDIGDVRYRDALVRDV